MASTACAQRTAFGHVSRCAPRISFSVRPAAELQADRAVARQVARGR